MTLHSRTFEKPNPHLGVGRGNCTRRAKAGVEKRGNGCNVLMKRQIEKVRQPYFTT
jgi:hypothetical protein